MGHNHTTRNQYLREAARLRHLVHAPCVIYGPSGPPVAFVLGCNDYPQGQVIFSRVATGTTVVVMTEPGVAIAVPPGSRALRMPRRITAHILSPVPH